MVHRTIHFTSPRQSQEAAMRKGKPVEVFDETPSPLKLLSSHVKPRYASKGLRPLDPFKKQPEWLFALSADAHICA